jgi:hypothetical protein
MVDDQGPRIPNGYHQALVQAIAIILSFSGAFVLYWAVQEESGEWTWPGLITTLALITGVALQARALLRCLRLEDDLQREYRVTVGQFRSGLVVLSIAILMAIVTASGILPYWPLFPEDADYQG